MDNDSGDGVLQRLLVEPGGIASWVRLVQLTSNHGYSGGMNRGVEALQRPTENILLLTHEVILDPDAAKEMSLLTRDSVAVGPILELPGGEIWSTGGFLTRTGQPRHRVDAISGSARPARWLDGACLLVNKSAFSRVGGLDERYFLYWEDVDLGVRLNGVGSVLCSSAARAQQATSTAPIYFDSRNRLRFWRKQRRVDVALMSCGELVLRLLFRDIPSGRRGSVQARLAGIRDGLRDNDTLEMNFVRGK